MKILLIVLVVPLLLALSYGMTWLLYILLSWGLSVLFHFQMPPADASHVLAFWAIWFVAGLVFRGTRTEKA